MFENFKRNRKLKAFRSNNVRCVQYSPESRVIALNAGRLGARLGFDLVEFDGKLQLAFHGDLIAGDGEALARVMKTMWNQQLPEFNEDERLREQLGKQSHLVPSEIAESGFENSAQEAEILYFRDMADYVAGMPNVVTVTVKTSWQIDK